MESEYVAMTKAVKNPVCFDRIRRECTQGILSESKSKSMLIDNQAEIHFVKSPVQNYKSKHIDIKLFIIRDLFYKD